MFGFRRQKRESQDVSRQKNLERCNAEISPYVSEGLFRVVFQTRDFTVICATNSAYAVFVHDAIDKDTNLTACLHLRLSEFKEFMEEPTMEQLKWFNCACQRLGINRAFFFTPQLIQKFRELKKQLDAQQKIEVDLVLEKQLVETAKRKYPHIERNNLAP